MIFEFFHKKSIAGVLLATIFSFGVNAGIIAIDEFNGDLFEGFESQQEDINSSFTGFDDNATFSVADGLYGTVEQWFGGDLQGEINPYEGKLLGSWFAGKDSMDILFNEQLSAFGGYFNSLSITKNSTISFFNNNNLITLNSLDVGFDEYIWQGWSVNEGTTFNRISITHEKQSFPNSFLIFDNLQANVASVPEPSSLAIFALGMVGLLSRRLNKQA